MTDLPEASSATPTVPAAPAVAAATPTSSGSGRWIAVGAAVLAALATAALVLAWNTQQRVKSLESELVKRQQDSGAQAAEARLFARQAQEVAREASGKIALLEARVSENSIQRSQLEDLIQSMSRSRDENVLADVDASIRVATQQTAITGSAEPLVSALKQADERLARYNQPRLERVRRAVTQDLDRTRAAGVSDVSVLTLRLDEAIRLIDQLPLLARVERMAGSRATSAPAAPAASAASKPLGWRDWLTPRWREIVADVGEELRALIRVTRIDQPEAILVTPEQTYFLRENLKLRLLNARLALLSRQFDVAQSDLRDAQAALERYFDRSVRRVSSTIDLVRQVAVQARVVAVPRPDATLAAIAAAAAGR